MEQKQTEQTGLLVSVQQKKTVIWAVFFVKDKAVVTSGGYERYFAGDDGRSTGISWIQKPALRPKTVWYP